MTSNTQKLNTILLLIVIILFSLQLCKRPVKTINSINSSVLDTIKTIISKNSDGDTIYIAQTKIIEAQAKDIKKLAALLKHHDSSLLVLTQAIKKNTPNVTYYNSVTNIYDSTTNITIIDSTYKYPTYKTSLNNKWYSADVEVNYDTAKLNVSFYNPFIVSHKYIKSGLFKKDLVIEVAPQNPYTKIIDLKSYQVPKKKHFFDLSVSGLATNISISAGLEARYRYNHFGAKAIIGYSNYGPYYGGGINYIILSNY